jgi:hypothetical protein
MIVLFLFSLMTLGLSFEVASGISQLAKSIKLIFSLSNGPNGGGCASFAKKISSCVAHF